MSECVLQAVLDVWAEAGRRSRAAIQGMSMVPLLRPGEVVVVVHSREALRCGQIVAYRSGERVIVHRLVRRRREGDLLLAGDSRVLADAPVLGGAVIGRVVAVEHEGRCVNLESRTAAVYGRALAASFPLRRWRVALAALAWLAHAGAWLVRR